MNNHKNNSFWQKIKQGNFKPNFALLWTMLKNDGKIITAAIRRTAKSVLQESPKTLLLGSALAVVLGFGMTRLLSPTAPTNSAPEVQSTLSAKAAKLARLNYVSPYDLRPDQQAKSNNTTRNVTLKSGQSLGPLLQKNDIDNQTAYLMTEAFKTVHKPRDLRAGQKFKLYFDDNNQIDGLTLRPKKDSTIFVRKSADGTFQATKIQAEYHKKLYRLDAKIENSLYLDAQSLGAPDKVIVQFSQIYAHSVDFQRDIRQGDEFEMLFEMFTDHQGKIIKAGDLVYTRFAPRGKSSAYYLFAKSNGSEGYYDHKGKGAKRMLMRTPVNGARLSSRYGSRRHPVLGYRRKHKGVDFAAPRGTPIMAAGTGTIVRSSRWGSFGNYVRIRHSDGYSTAYAHLSKYGRGIKKGRRVRQGQTIGYVGATGRVTGAHLHYEVLKNGRQINPMSLSTLSGKPLHRKELPAFKTRAKEIDGLRENTAILQAVQTVNAQPTIDKTP